MTANPRHRLPFTTALVGVTTLLLLLTAAAIGGLSYRHAAVTAETLMRAGMQQAASLAADRARGMLQAAEAAVDLGPALVAQGVLDPNDDAALARYVLSVLRTHPDLTWVSFAGLDERFTGAWVDAKGDRFLNRSWPEAGRIRLEEVRVAADDARTPVRTSDDHGYLPSKRPYFQKAAARGARTWTDPYGFYGQGLGITCAAPVPGPSGGLRGVFTVDLSLDRLSLFLRQVLRISANGKTFLVDADGRLLAGPHAADAPAAERKADADLVAAALRAGRGTQEGTLHRPDGNRLIRLAPLQLPDLAWQVVVIVPEADFLGRVHEQTRQTVLLSLGALVLAIVAGVATARWIARPLRNLTAQARRIRQGDLDVAFVPQSRDEIGTLTETMAEMVQGLRDRDFITAALGRYVSPELADQFLRDRSSLRLGGELREVTILMSDLRGFSGLSEQLGPEAMLRLLNRYFACMTPIVQAHAGTINEFIGDAMLVLFGAPVQRPDDAERAVRCAAAMQLAMHAFNAESAAQGAPELQMGIGLHTGAVVAGNIGSADHVKYGVVGPAVNLASRIESQTVGAQVLVSTATLERTGHAARVGPARELALKGAALPTVVHLLLGTADGPDLQPARATSWIDVDLAAALYLVDGTSVATEAQAARVRRIAVDAVEVTGVAGLSLSQPFKLDVAFAGDGPRVATSQQGAGSYAKVIAVDAGAGTVVAAFTSLAAADRGAIAALAAAASPPLT